MQDFVNLSGYSDLHDRLDHLVTYSSQLIFISGDSMGKEKDFVESYLAKKSDVANIAYFSGSSRLSITQYRQRIVEQLVGKLQLDYSRPLTELLPRMLGNDEQFILLVVTRAHEMDNVVLRELWDVVLQNRFARQRHHLNILLFGEHQWAEDAKTWLPTNHNDQPVLLSHQSLSVQELAPFESELDQLIRDKRRLFEERMQRRNDIVYRQPLMQHWWAKMLVMLVFLMSFGGLVQWQYAEQTESLLADVYSMLFEPMPNPVATLPTETVTDDVDDIDDLSVVTTVSDAPEILITAKTPSVAGKDDQQLVTNWQTASAGLAKRPQSMTESSAESLTPVDNTADPEKVLVISQVVPQEPKNALSEQSATTAAQQVIADEVLVDDDAVNDYPVADIVSYPANTSADTTEETELPVDIYRFDENAILQQPPSSYFLQLSAMSSEQILNEYLIDNNLSGQVWVYVTQRYGGPWYVVVMNETFDSIASTQQVVASLAPRIQASEPFAKAANQVHKEIDL